MKSTNIISVEQTINVPVEIVWDTWTSPGHIMQWNNASDDWHTPHAENDLRKGGSFNYRMESKDGKFGFDFSGVYDSVEEHQLLEYTIGDGRKVTVRFISENDATKIIESFEAENQHSAEMQRAGWQSILDNFKKYCESNRMR